MPLNSQKEAYFRELKDICQSKNIWQNANPLAKIIIQSRYIGMYNRCYCKSNVSYEIYGARGIEVCESWKHNPRAYLLWFCNELAKYAGSFNSVSEAYNELSVDRKNPKGHYSPQNCELILRVRNDYTTTTPARCIMWDNKWTPIWHIESRLNIPKDAHGNGISDKIRGAIARIKHGGRNYTAPHSYFISGYAKYLKCLNVRELLCETGFYVFYDFYKNPLKFDSDKLKAQCPLCDCKEVAILNNDGEVIAKCDKCDFMAVLLTRKFKKENEISLEYLANLPKKLLNHRVKKHIWQDSLTNTQKSHNVTLFKRFLDSEYRKECKEKAEVLQKAKKPKICDKKPKTIKKEVIILPKSKPEKPILKKCQKVIIHKKPREMIVSEKPKKLDLSAMVAEFKVKQGEKPIRIKYCGRVFVWQNADDRIFCKCGVGVLGIDLANQTTTRCADCGFIMTLQGERIA